MLCFSLLPHHTLDFVLLPALGVEYSVLVVESERTLFSLHVVD